MPELGNNSFSQSPFFAKRPMATAPPSPSEVKVRTMRTDLDAMAKSGGGLPRFQNMKVAGLSMERQATLDIAEAGGKSHVVMILGATCAVVVLGAVGYFAYQAFRSNGQGAAVPPPPPAAQVQGNTAAGASQSANIPSSTTAAPTASFTHVSLFKQPADGTLTLTLSLGGTASNAIDLQTFNQKLSTALAGKTAALTEVVVKNAGGNDLRVSEILSQANEQIMDPSLLAAHFDPDATFFAYRNAAGFWPGYVFSLKAGQNWLFSTADVVKLETSPSITNFFLTDVGAPAKGGFVDGTVSSTPVRMLTFTKGTAASTFVYGWYKSVYLIVSTSKEGFAAAMARL